jgi:hypothetical protein
MRGGGFGIDANKKPNNETTLLVLPVTSLFISVDRSRCDGPSHVRNPEIVTTTRLTQVLAKGRNFILYTPCNRMFYFNKRNNNNCAVFGSKDF